MIFDPVFSQMKHLCSSAKQFVGRMTCTQKSVGMVLLGALLGCGALTIYMLRAHTYIGDDPAACVNCHIMTPYYATWMHSSHSRNATCNDCHVPHENVARKYAFKAIDGMKHVSAFVSHTESQSPRPTEAAMQVIMNNCIRCHNELNTTLAGPGRIDYMMTRVGNGKVCWDCHRDVPHGGQSSLCLTPNAKVPLPDSPVPQWLQSMIE